MKIVIVEIPGVGYVARRTWLFGLFHTYIDNSNPVMWGSWGKGNIGEAICPTRERAEKMGKTYRVIKAL